MGPIFIVHTMACCHRKTLTILRTRLALLLERVTFDPQTRKMKIVYRFSPKLGQGWRPHGYPTLFRS